MNIEIDSSECSCAAEPSAIKVVIIYEDFATGSRAKNFADRLAERISCACQLSASIWRSELLECPPIAEEAARGAADCDYLILSLRGDRVLPFAARQWIETQLDGAGERGSGLIVLCASNQGKWRVLEGTRHYFQSVCAVKGVPFFAHTLAPPPDAAAPSFRDGEEADARAPSPSPRRPALPPHEGRDHRRQDLIHDHR